MRFYSWKREIIFELGAQEAGRAEVGGRLPEQWRSCLLTGEAVWEGAGQNTDIRIGESCKEPSWRGCIVNCWLFSIVTIIESGSKKVLHVLDAKFLASVREAYPSIL